jgi:hypothetical protein
VKVRAVILALALFAVLAPGTASARKLVPPLTMDGTVSGVDHNEALALTTTWNGSVHWALEQGTPLITHQYTYLGTGQVTYTISGGDLCAVSGTSTFQIVNDDAFLNIYHEKGKWTYDTDIALRSAPPFIAHETCPDASGDSDQYRPVVLEMDFLHPPPVPRGLGSVSGTHEQGAAKWTWSFSGTPRSISPLEAVPGGPYRVRRAGRVRLDGSGSRPKKAIVDYRWSFRPRGGDCEGDVSGGASHKVGKQTRIVALCGVEATLTVVDRDGDRDSASTEVEVLPRGPGGWRTPLSHREKTGDPRTPRDPPSATSVGGGNYAFSLFGGLNVSDCGGAQESVIVCPPAGQGNSWLGDGYELDRVDDPNGPFDGDFYVASSSLRVKRAGLINPSILPGSSFYRHNLETGKDVAGFVNAIKQHEGLGNGTPGTGHSGIMKEILETPAGDPRRAIEKLFAPSRDGARHRADDAIRGIDRRLDRESDDPLPDIWTGDIEFFDAYQNQWITGQGFRIPGPMRG